MSGAKSVRKGKRYERRVAVELRRVYAGARRALQFQREHEAPDVAAGPLWCEVKSYSVPTVRTWRETAAKMRAAGATNDTAAVVQPSGGTGPLLITLPLRDFVELLLAAKAKGCSLR